MTELRFDDPHAFADWRVFTARAQHLDADGAMRLSVFGSVLVLTVAPLYPHGLGDPTPLVLGMRMLPLPARDLDGIDSVVPLAALSDRFARAHVQDTLVMPIPPQEVSASWAGIAPPRGSWEPAGMIPAAAASAAAEAGIAEVAQGTPPGAGSAAVSALRRRVWSRPLIESAAEAPPSAGAAFALHGLGFIHSAGLIELRRSATWLRLSTPTGHVLTRVKAA